jgi:hypothetical protein
LLASQTTIITVHDAFPGHPAADASQAAIIPVYDAINGSVGVQCITNDNESPPPETQPL